MITEGFLNSCYSIALNKTSNVKKDLSLYRDIFEILSYCENQKTVEIPVQVQTKFEAIKKICSMKLDGKEIDSILDSILFSEKFKNLSDFINLKRNEELKDHVTIDIVKQLRLRKKINSLFSNYDNLSNFLDSIQDGTFDSIDDAVLDYEDIIKTLYTNMMQSNRGVAIEESSSLDLEKDDYDNVLKLIIKKYERVNTTQTGYHILDNEVFNGGFEPSRIYILGGGSGSGKSTLLNNLIVNAATKFPNTSDPDRNSTIKNVYVYITMENTIEEALLRTYQPMFNKTMTEVIQDIKNNVNIKQRILNELKKTNSTIIMKYFPAMSISVLDIMSLLDDVISEYGKDSIQGCFIDYLDLLRSDIKYDIYRMELGQITLSLKTMAVEYNIPVITATQLGRSAYKTEESRDLNLDMISESIKKVEHADCIILLVKDMTDETIVHVKIGKNRSGKSDVALDFKVNFSHFKFINAMKVSNKMKQDATIITNEEFEKNGVKLDFGGFDKSTM